MTFFRSLIRRALGALATLALLWLLLSVLLMAAVPWWAPGRGAALASEALGRPVTLERARYQPWRAGLVLEGLSVGAATAGQPPLLSLRRLELLPSLGALLRGDIELKQLSLQAPELRLSRLAAGRYDIDDLIQRWSQPSDGPGPGVAIRHLAVQDGQLLFDDRPLGRQHRLDQLQLVLPFVSTLADDAQLPVQPLLSGRLDGVAFDSRADARPFAAERNGQLAFKLQGLDLAPFAGYWPADLPWRLQKGRLGMDLSLDFAAPAGQGARVKLAGQLLLDELELRSAEGQARLGWAHLALPLVDVQPLARRVALGKIQLSGPYLLGDWPTAPPPAKPAAPAAKPGPDWRLGIAGLALTQGRLDSAGLQLDDIGLQLGALAWPLAGESRAELALKMQGAPLNAQLRLSPQQLGADLTLQPLQLARVARWLPLPPGMALQGLVSGRASATLAQPLAEQPLQRLRLALQQVALDDTRLTLAGARQPALGWRSARLDQATLDLGSHQLALGTLSLDGLDARAARDAQGRLDLAALTAESGDTEKTQAPPPRGAAWQLRLQGLALQNAGLHWQDDAAPGGAVSLGVRELKLSAGPLHWPEGGSVPLKLEGRLAGARPAEADSRAGRFSLEGQALLNTQGLGGLQAQLRARALPVQLLAGYLDPAYGLHLDRAELSLKTSLDARHGAQGWQLGAQGGLDLNSLALMQVRRVDGRAVVGEDLLSWQGMKLEDFKFSLAPAATPRLDVGTLTLDDAYARLIVDAQGRLNLRDLGPARPDNAVPAASATAPAPDAPLPVRVALRQTRINQGLVDFNDRFIKPNYSARLSELQGSLGAFDTDEPATAPLTLRGRVMGNGLLDVTGELRPGRPLALDVQAQASDIELSPMSPYAGKYVGYAIEGGRLSTKLRYRIAADGQLNASNQIILNQLSFGDRVESPDATTLPVRFAVALLKDSRGVIDIDLPVSGSINDPEFSVGGIVWRLILNLIGKALTSPFALFGGGDDGGPPQLSFEPGGREVIQTAALQRLARQLQDRPAVRLSVAGWADAATDAEALKRQQLDAALAATGKAPDQALRQLYRATPGPDKAKNWLGMEKDLPPAQMRAWLLARQRVDDEALRRLAVARATAVRDQLQAQGVPAERLQLAPPQLRHCEGSCEPGWQPHVQLSLDTR